MPRNNRRDRARGAGSVAATHAPAGQGAARDAGPRRGGGEVRIVGGAWRGRKIAVSGVPGLRPTPDRVRETLFNWLQFEIAGRRCLDLFAGSGALGLEALSRGAAEVVFVERERVAVDAIEAALARFGSERGRVVQADAFAWLREAPRAAFDLVFVDPPFAEARLGEAVARLEASGGLADGAWIYLEDAAARGAPALPPGWALVRSKRAGDVGYHLARRGAAAAGEAERGGSA